MVRDVRSLVIATMLALYGSVSMFGDGLHRLAGIAHDCPSSADFEGHDQPLISSHESCPLCEYHVQAQHPTASADAASEPGLVDVHTTSRTLSVPASAPLRAQPRAPPIA